MKNSLLIAARTFVLCFLVLGLGYPLFVTGVSHVLLSERAQGSLVRTEDDTVLGSRVIGQQFTHEAYFHPRPSAQGYGGLSSGGTNLAPTSRALASALTSRALDYGPTDDLPPDLITSSASGLDPHISPGNALRQVTRVAAARGVPANRIDALVNAHIVGPDLGFIGEPRVNVLELNLALDRTFGRP